MFAEMTSEEIKALIADIYGIAIKRRGPDWKATIARALAELDRRGDR